MLSLDGKSTRACDAWRRVIGCRPGLYGSDEISGHHRYRKMVTVLQTRGQFGRICTHIPKPGDFRTQDFPQTRRPICISHTIPSYFSLSLSPTRHACRRGKGRDKCEDCKTLHWFFLCVRAAIRQGKEDIRDFAPFHTPLGWNEVERNCLRVLDRFREPLLRLLEVDDVPDGLEVVGLDVLILDVERVLPNVDADDRDVS